MRVIKPQTLSLLSCPFEFRTQLYCGISVIAFMPLERKRTLLSELGVWPVVGEALGASGAIDAGLPKRNGEFLVTGHAWTDEASGSSSTHVGVKLGDKSKVLQVTGDRYFKGAQISPPEPFEAMPLLWENAFGGEGFGPNPVGKGFSKVVGPDGVKRQYLPNIEYPGLEMTRPDQRPRPAGFGPIDISWPERQKKAGTYGSAWFPDRYPGFADDIDWSFFNVAAGDQQYESPFKGTESFVLRGLSREASRIDGALPSINARCFVRRKETTSLEEPACSLTTVWFFPDLGLAALVFHTSLEVEKPDASDLAEVMIAADWIEEQRPSSYFVEVLERRLDEDVGMFEMLNDADLMPEGMKIGGGLDAEEVFAKSKQSIRGQQMPSRLDQEMEDAMSRLDREFAELGVKRPPAPERKAPPKVDIESIRFSDLPRVISELEAYSEECKKEAESFKQEAEEALAGLGKELGVQTPDELGDLEKGRGPGPPTFNAEEKIREITELQSELSEMGVNPPADESGLLSSDVIDFLHNAEVSAHAAYRSAAHLQQPAGSRHSDESARDKLISLVSSGETVEGMDFTGAQLDGLVLQGANLKGIYLESASLVGANLEGACLDDAVLAHADLSESVLDGASLQRANLGKARLDRASLVSCCLRDSILMESQLHQARLDNSDLTNADTFGMELQLSSLSGVTLSDYLVLDSSVAGVNFENAILPDAVFIRSDMSSCNFSGATLDGVTIVGTRGKDSVFENASLNNARIVQQSDFSGARFKGAKMGESCLRESCLLGADFSYAGLRSSDLSSCSLEGANFTGADLRQCQFVESDLRGADLSNADLMNASLERADIRDASLLKCNLYGVDMARVRVSRETDFEEANLDRSRTHPRLVRNQAQ